MDERTRSLLTARALVLARPVAHGETREMLELILFRISGEQFAVDARRVLEVFRARDIARLPDSEAPWAGVTVWRGNVLTVLDLRPLFGLPRNTADQMTHIVVIGRDRAALGLLVELNRDTLRVAAADLEAWRDSSAWVRALTPSGLQILDEDALIDL